MVSKLTCLQKMLIRRNRFQYFSFRSADGGLLWSIKYTEFGLRLRVVVVSTFN